MFDPGKEKFANTVTDDMEEYAGRKLTCTAQRFRDVLKTTNGSLEECYQNLWDLL